MRPEGGGPMCDRPPASERPAASTTPGSPPLGRLPEELTPARHAIVAGSTAQCHAVRGYRFDGLLVSGSGCRATCAGACPGGDQPDGSCPAAGGCVDAQATLRACPCDHHWLRRPTALSGTTQSETKTATVDGRKEGEG